jgi:beta-lactamase regulating signal transducer with metallopeptidase domain
MLARLTPLQRRIMLAHEAAHLRLRHHHYVQLGRLAAAANPLLRPVSSAIDLAVERWADEDAAREAGDRTATAHALLAAASAGPAGPQPGGALHAAQAHLPDRLACLLRRPAPHRLLATVLLVAAVTAWAAGCLLTGHVHALLELAESA